MRFSLSPLLFGILCLSGFRPAAGTAHPAWGVVADEAGNIFFTDLFHNGGSLWRLDRSGGLRAIRMNLHSHSLSAGPEGSIWAGDHQWIQGYAEGDGENTLLRIDGEGRITELVRTRDGSIFYGNNIAVDGEGRVYFERDKRLYRWRAGQRAAPLGDRVFGRIITSFASRDGCLYVTDNNFAGGSLVRIDPADGRSAVIAGDLLEERPANPPFDDPLHNMLFGIAQDAAGDFYVCNSGSRLVWRIDDHRKKAIVYRSEDPWYPVGVAIRDGSLIVMECGYREGQGHLGPRIIGWDAGSNTAEVLAEVGSQARPDCEWCGAADAPPDPGWQAVIPPVDEPGEALVMEGRVFKADGATPAPGVLIYVYHTNAQGVYPKRGDETGNGQRHGYLRAWMKTDEQGRYRFRTIRPAPYPGRDDPAHIHITLTPPGGTEDWIDSFWFKGDPLITGKQLRKVTRPAGQSNVVELSMDKNGVWQGRRDILLR